MNSDQLHQKLSELDALFEAAEARTRMIFQALPIALCIVDRDGKIQAMNPVAETLFSYKASEVSGRPINQLLGQFKIDYVGSGPIKSAGQKQSGESFPTEVTATRLADDREASILVAIQDITEREELNRMKAEFVAMISHDLRTPLTSVSCFLEGITVGMYGDAPAKLREKASATGLEVQRLVALVERLLRVEQIEEGRLNIVKTRVPIENLSRQALNAVRDLAASRSIRFDCAVADDFIEADAEQLVQVLVNLLGNAIKYSPPSEVVKLEIAERDSEFLFEVTDQGPGIEEQFIQTIFDRYEKVKGDKVAEKQGTGLGLAICKAIVTAHGGTIGVKSTPGSGSIFWFTIPK